MIDQAGRLRELVNSKSNIEVPIMLESNSSKGDFKIITVTSGKGGVGKSNFSVNLAIALKELGKNPLILDADFGLSDVNVLLGESANYTINDVLTGKRCLKDVIVESRYGIKFISGGSGIPSMVFLSDQSLDRIITEIANIQDFADVLIIDTGAGINNTVIKFSELADEICLIVTPEMTSITDSYALIKTLVTSDNIKNKIKLVVNKVDNHKEAIDVYYTLSATADKFLSSSILYGGSIPYSKDVVKCGKIQVPILDYMPNCSVSMALRGIANSFLGNNNSTVKENFMSRLKKMFIK